MKQTTPEPTSTETFDTNMEGYGWTYEMPSRGRGCGGRGRGACMGGPGRTNFLHMGPRAQMYSQGMGSGPFGCPPWMMLQQRPSMWQYQPMMPPYGCPEPWAMDPRMSHGHPAGRGMRGGMMQKPMLMHRLNRLMKLMEEEGKMKSDNQAEMTEDPKASEPADAGKPEGKSERGPCGRRHHFMQRLQKMTEDTDSSNSDSSESDTENASQNPRHRMMMKLMKVMKEDGDKLLEKENASGKPYMKGEGPRSRMMMHLGPWAAHAMMTEDRPGLPPQLLRRIRQLVKSMEEDSTAEIADEKEADNEENKIPKTKKQQLRRLLRMLEGANVMRGPAGRRMPPWVTAGMTEATDGHPCVPPRLVKRIRSLVKSMEDGDSTNQNEKIESEEQNATEEEAEATTLTNENVTDE